MSPAASDDAAAAPFFGEPKDVARERLLLTLAVLAYFVAGFETVAAVAAPGRAHTLHTAFDDAIPLVPWTVFLYSWVYASALYPVFVLRSRALLRRAVVAATLTLTVAFVCFAVYPVTSVGLRPDPSLLDDTRFDEWGLRLTYFADPPYNLFPSLHLGTATVAALSAGRASRWLGLAGAPVVLAIAVTICTTKQHYLVDGVAAMVLAAAVWFAVLRTARPEPGEAPAFGWRGAAVYVGFHALVYGFFGALFLAGYRPWAR